MIAQWALCLAVFTLLALSFTDRGAMWWMQLPGVLAMGDLFLFVPMFALAGAWFCWAKSSKVLVDGFLFAIGVACLLFAWILACAFLVETSTTQSRQPSTLLQGPLFISATSTLHSLSRHAHARPGNTDDPVLRRLDMALASGDANQLRHAVFVNISPARPRTLPVLESSLAALGLLDHPPSVRALARGWATKQEMAALRGIALELANQDQLATALQQGAYLALTQDKGLYKPLGMERGNEALPAHPDFPEAGSAPHPGARQPPAALDHRKDGSYRASCHAVLDVLACRILVRGHLDCAFILAVCNDPDHCHCDGFVALIRDGCHRICIRLPDPIAGPRPLQRLGE